MIDSIISGTASNLLAGIILGLIALISLDEKRALRPWVFKYLTPYAAKTINSILSLILSVELRIVILIYVLMTIQGKSVDLLSAVVILLISLSFLIKNQSVLRDNPAPLFSDEFSNLEKNRWTVRTGNPVIESNFGKPAPDLGLEMADPPQATNSFLILKNNNFESGIIECDFWLEQYSVLNIVFYCDDKDDKWFMARYDSRIGNSDGILIKEKGFGVNWEYYKMSGTKTTSREWHRARVEFSSVRASMYIDGKLIVEIENPRIFGRKVGFFNEVGYVHIDNFTIARGDVV